MSSGAERPELIDHSELIRHSGTISPGDLIIVLKLFTIRESFIMKLIV